MEFIGNIIEVECLSGNIHRGQEGIEKASSTENVHEFAQEYAP
jgi:hypothetical protein